MMRASEVARLAWASSAPKGKRVNGGEDYVEEIRVVRRRRDTYRSNSSKSDEFESDLLRSETPRGVAGPTESRAVDEDELRERYQGDPIHVSSDASSRELSPGHQAIADAIMEVADVVMRELVVPLIRDVAAPAAKAKYSELAERRRARALERAETKAKAREVKVTKLEEVDELAPTPVSTEVDELEPSVLMTRSEVLLARLQLKLAEDYAAKQRWLLEHAEAEEMPEKLAIPSDAYGTRESSRARGHLPDYRRLREWVSASLELPRRAR